MAWIWVCSGSARSPCPKRGNAYAGDSHEHILRTAGWSQGATSSSEGRRHGNCSASRTESHDGGTASETRARSRKVTSAPSPGSALLQFASISTIARALSLKLSRQPATKSCAHTRPPANRGDFAPGQSIFSGKQHGCCQQPYS